MDKCKLLWLKPYQLHANEYWMIRHSLLKQARQNYYFFSAETNYMEHWLREILSKILGKGGFHNVLNADVPIIA